MALKVFVAKRRVVSGEPAGIRAWIFLGDGRKFLSSVLRAGLLRGVERLAGIGGIRSRGDARGISLHGHVKRRSCLHRFAVGIKTPARIAKADEHHRQDGRRENCCVRKNGLGAMLDGIVDFVLLQFLARNMFRHKRSPAWFGNLNRSTRRSEPASELRKSCPHKSKIYPCSMNRKRPQLRGGGSVKFE